VKKLYDETSGYLWFIWLPRSAASAFIRKTLRRSFMTILMMGVQADHEAICAD